MAGTYKKSRKDRKNCGGQSNTPSMEDTLNSSSTPSSSKDSTLLPYSFDNHIAFVQTPVNGLTDDEGLAIQTAASDLSLSVEVSPTMDYDDGSNIALDYALTTHGKVSMPYTSDQHHPTLVIPPYSTTETTLLDPPTHSRDSIPNRDLFEYQHARLQNNTSIPTPSAENPYTSGQLHSAAFVPSYSATNLYIYLRNRQLNPTQDHPHPLPQNTVDNPSLPIQIPYTSGQLHPSPLLTFYSTTDLSHQHPPYPLPQHTFHHPMEPPTDNPPTWSKNINHHLHTNCVTTNQLPLETWLNETSNANLPVSEWLVKKERKVERLERL